jgi:hypothetical protein
MNSDRLVRFLATYTAPSFRRALLFSPYTALAKAGFQAGEIGLLTASLAKIRAKPNGSHELEEWSRTFFTEDVVWTGGGSAFSDSWKA